MASGMVARSGNPRRRMATRCWPRARRILHTAPGSAGVVRVLGEVRMVLPKPRLAHGRDVDARGRARPPDQVHGGHENRFPRFEHEPPAIEMEFQRLFP